MIPPSRSHPIAAWASPSSRWASLTALAAGAVLLAGLSACGSADNAKACADIRQVTTELTQKGMQQFDDPAALQQTYRSSAATIRQRADDADGDVQAAAGKLADAVDKLGDDVGRAAASTSTVPQLPDTGALIQAGTQLQQACT